jgi:hypothetical protein
MPAFWAISRAERAAWSATLVAAAISIAWVSNAAQAAPKEEALLVAEDAQDLILFRRSEVSRQISYTMDLAYPARAVGEPQWGQLRKDGWTRCRSVDRDEEAANSDWISYEDISVTPKRRIYAHLTHWFKDNQMIMVSLRYYSAAQSGAVPDNTEQHVNLVFDDDHGREIAEWLKLDCSK